MHECIPYEKITICLFAERTDKTTRAPKGGSGFLMAFFCGTGLNHRRLGVHNLPAGGLFFVLFQFSHLANSISEAGEIIPQAAESAERKNSVTSSSRPGAKGLSSPASSRKARK